MNSSTFIGNLFLVYVVAQLLTTAYGLTVIGTLKPIIEEKLKNKGYSERDKNSLYKFNDQLTSVLLALVPFYYGYKGLKLIQGKDAVNRAVDEEIVSGDWITKDEQRKIFEKTELEKNDESLFVPRARVEFEKPETYRARRVDNSLYDVYETPIEYATREMDKSDALKITPFMTAGELPKVIESGISTKDVARFIAELDEEELKALRNEINKLIDRIENDKYILSYEKDVA